MYTEWVKRSRKVKIVVSGEAHDNDNWLEYEMISTYKYESTTAASVMVVVDIIL